MPLISEFQYEKILTQQIYNDFSNSEFLSDSFRNYLSVVFPEYDLHQDAELEMSKNGKFKKVLDQYYLSSNVDLTELNKKFKTSDLYSGFDISYFGFLHALSETRGDTFIAASFESEIVTSELYSNLMQLQLNTSIQRRIESQEEIDTFHEYAIQETRSIGDAFSLGIITRRELLKILEEGEQFRDWLNRIGGDKSMIGEYHKDNLPKGVFEKLPGKTTRFVIFEGMGVLADVMGAGGAGTIAAVGLAAFDTFYLDKMMAGWKPNQYIDNTIKPLAARENFRLYT